MAIARFVLVASGFGLMRTIINPVFHGERFTMYGWRGRALRVDLTRGLVREESLDPRVAKDYIGGRGLGIQRLLAEANPQCDPLGAENILVMAAGPLTGTKAPTGARYMVMNKSPLTGSITCSNSGGHFPAELKKAGVDLISFHGQAA